MRAISFNVAGVLAVVACLALPGFAGAQAEGEADFPAQPGPKASVELLVPGTAVAPGQTLQVGVKLTIADGWHIYWKNPGDSGLPPTFRWMLPGGGASRAMRGSEWSVSEVQFPAPVRWQDMMGLVGYGYEGTVIFLAEVQVPASTTPGQVVELGVQVDYMVCKEICLNESGGDKVELTVVAGSAEGMTEEEGSTDAGEPVRRREEASELEQAKVRVPQPVGEDTATVKTGEDGAIVIEAQLLEGARNVQAFPAPPQGVVVERVTVDTAGERATVSLRVRRLAGMEVKEKQFEVVVGYDLNEDRRGVSVMVPLPGGEQARSE